MRKEFCSRKPGAIAKHRPKPAPKRFEKGDCHREWPHSCGHFWRHYFRPRSKRAAELKELQHCCVAVLERELSKTPTDQAVAESMVDFCASKGFMAFKGTYDADVIYEKGNICVHDGASWCALTKTVKNAKPGRAPEWRLIMKSDGK